MKNIILTSFVLLLFVPLLGHASNGLASDYMVPTPKAIPDGFFLFLYGPSKGGYNIQYNHSASKNGVRDGVLIISELPLSYDTTVKSIKEEIARRPRQEDQIKDIAFHGLGGILHDNGQGGYEILLNDDGKLLHISASNEIGGKIFTAENVEGMLQFFTRQPLNGFTPPSPAQNQSVDAHPTATTPTMPPPSPTQNQSADVLSDQIPMDIKGQYALYEKTKDIAANDNDRAITWTIRHQSELIPSFLLQLSDRLLARDPNQAFEWYIVGIIRGSYDTARCVQPNATGEILGIFAPQTMRYAKQNMEPFLAAGRKVLNRPDLFDYSAPPQWICAGSINPTSTNVLKAEKEWPFIKERVLAESRLKYGDPSAYAASVNTSGSSAAPQSTTRMASTSPPPQQTPISNGIATNSTDLFHAGNGCARFVGCVDGADAIALFQSTFTHRHIRDQQIGTHASCPPETKVKDGGFFIEGTPIKANRSINIGLTNLKNYKSIMGRGTVLPNSNGELVIDDTQFPGASEYIIDFCP